MKQFNIIYYYGSYEGMGATKCHAIVVCGKTQQRAEKHFLKNNPHARVRSINEV